MGKDHTLFALVDGTVSFKVTKEDRRYVSIIPAEATEA
jgi:large subunit ribosomal protein L27